MITKEYALAFVNDYNGGDEIKTEEDALYASCVHWDPALQYKDVGEGRCSCCYLFNCITGVCPLKVSPASGCCAGHFGVWADASCGTEEETKAATAVFEFIKAKYREVSGKDYA